jgi:hypothetical protein
MMMLIPRILGRAPVTVNTYSAKGEFDSMSFSRKNGMLLPQGFYQIAFALPWNWHWCGGAGKSLGAVNAVKIFNGDGDTL